MDQVTGRRRRRTYSAEFKAEAVAACRRRGASIAAAAIERSMNANVLRLWVVDVERAEQGVVATVGAPLALPAPRAKDAFVALPKPAKATDDTPVKVKVRRGTLTVRVQWPSSTIHECAIWLREVLK